jgi:hypothetical protein
MKTNRWIIFITIVLLLTACAPSQVAVQGSPADTQAAIPAGTPTATAIPTAQHLPAPVLSGWGMLALQDYRVHRGVVLNRAIHVRQEADLPPTAGAV